MRLGALLSEGLMRVWAALAAVVVFLAPGAAVAQVLMPVHTARTLGMGGTGVAASHGASALHSNAALVAFEESLGGEVGLGFAGVSSSTLGGAWRPTIAAALPV